MKVKIKLFRRANNPFYQALCRIAGFDYHHAALQLGNRDYFLHIKGLISEEPERADKEFIYEVNDIKYENWRKKDWNKKGRFHALRYLFSPWIKYNNCMCFVSDLLFDNPFYHPNQLTEKLCQQQA